MTETEHLIKQAARELQIEATVWQRIDGEVITYSATFKSNNGDPAHISIKDGEGYLIIHEAMKAAFKRKQSNEQ